MKTIHSQLAIMSVLGASAFAACSAEAPDTEDVSSEAAGIVAGAAYTTFVDADGCLHGNGNGINCNHYRFKSDVYMNGGPERAGLSDGDYYFAVLVPGSQNGGFNDGAGGNLSDDFDTEANRTFTVDDHEIVAYTGTHDTGDTPNGKFAISLFPYEDTTNNGGVYILAICQVGATSPRQCKFDAFKVEDEEPPPPPPPCCGDNVIDEGEDCDGTAMGECSYGCTAECTCEPPPPPPPCCGDDVIDDGEDCDGTAMGECSYGCTAECTCDVPVCGDGVLEGDEVCDDGNTVDGDYCAADCSCETVPNGID